MSLNPCSDGMLAVIQAQNVVSASDCLNPCCNGMLWLRFRGWWCRGCFVLILVVMESLGSRRGEKELPDGRVVS